MIYGRGSEADDCRWIRAMTTNARKVVVEFSAEKAELVAGRVWHPTQELSRVAGGLRGLDDFRVRAPFENPRSHWHPSTS